MAVVVASCGVVDGRSGSPDAEASCSAQQVAVTPMQPRGLPAPASAMRQQVLRAAMRCDYDLLDALALSGGREFVYSSVEPSDPTQARPGRYWRQQEARGEQPLARLVQVLSVGYMTSEQTVVGRERMYVWPSAAGEETTAADWNLLGGAYPAQTLERWRRDGRYRGHLVGITADGSWRFFILAQ